MVASNEVCCPIIWFAIAVTTNVYVLHNGKKETVKELLSVWWTYCNVPALCMLII